MGRTVAWLLRRGLSGRWPALLAIVAASFVGVATGAIAFGLLVVFVRSKVSGSEAPGAGFEGLIASRLGDGVVAYAVAALLLGTASAACTYFAKRGALYLARDFHASVIRDAGFAIKHDGAASTPEMLAPSHGARHIPTLYARHSATVLRLLLEAVLPLVTSVAAVGILFIVDTTITLSLFPLAIAGVLVLLRLSRRGAGLLRRYQEKAAELMPFVNDALDGSGGGDSVDGEDSPAPSPRGDSKLVADALGSLYDQTLLSRQVQLANSVLQVVSMTWLVLLFGRSLESGSSSWSSILVFLIALRYAWQCLGRLSVLVVEIGRFWPSVEICAHHVSMPP